MNRILILSLASIVAGATMADETDEVVDEITVMGVRDLGALRAELVRAEDAVYDLYNDLNDDDDYDIICKREALIGSQIKKRICQARLYRDALAEATEDDDAGIASVGPLVNEGKHSKILREKMRDVANKNPQLIIALRNRLVLERKFNFEREKKFGDDDN